MKFDADTLKTRKPLWVVLSDLFLDTELEEKDIAFIAKTLHKSIYSLNEIDDILMLEVFPVCIANLQSVAGAWTGFDENQLVDAIIAAKRPNRFRQWMNRRSFWMIESDWEAVVKRYKEL